MVEHSIICDWCGTVGDASDRSSVSTRKALRADRGWQTNLPGGKDKCEHCQGDDAAAARRTGHGDRS